MDRKRNKRIPHLNGGYTLIEHLLSPENARRDPFTKRVIPDPVSQHDMTIATTVIQWLGTNCGRCFIEQAEAEIKKRSACSQQIRNRWTKPHPEAWKEATENGQLNQIAQSIASNFISYESHKSVHTALVRAITNALIAVSSSKVDAAK